MTVLLEAFGVDALPSTWEEKPLAAVARERKGNKNTGMTEVNLLSLSYGNIIRKDIDGTGGLLPESFDGYQIVEPGDLVMRLTDLQNDKRSLRSGLCTERGIITSAYLALEPTGLESRYFAYLFRAYDVAKVFYPLGGGLRQSIGFDDIRRLPIVVPPLDEQRRIADFLDDQVGRIDHAIALRGRQIEQLRMRADVMAIEILTGMREGAKASKSTSDEWISELPSGWLMQRLKFLVSFDNSGTWGSEQGESEIDAPVATTAQISNDGLFYIEAMPIRGFTLEDFKKYSCKANDILVVKSSGSATNVISGKCGRVGEDTPEFVFSNFLMRLRTNDTLMSEWIFEFLQSKITKERVKRMVSVTTYPNLRTEEYMNALVPVPPHEEIQGLIERLRHIRLTTQQAEVFLANNLDSLRELKRSLITAAVTGQIDATIARTFMAPKASTDPGTHFDTAELEPGRPL